MIVLNRTLTLVIDSVKEARTEGRYDLHLPKGTLKNPQPPDAKCPSNNPFGIQCTCVDAGMSQKLRPSYGPTFILAPPALLSHWLGQTKRFLDMKAQKYEWTLRHAYSDGKLRAYAPKLEKEDRRSVAPYGDIPYFDDANNKSHVLCFTTADKR